MPLRLVSRSVAEALFRQTCCVERLLLDEVFETDYGQFDLLWGADFGFDRDFARAFKGQVNGLVGWPAPSEPDAILRTTSANAAYWHSEVGNRR